MLLAPLRGVTTHCFRTTFADVIVEAGFDEAVTPFISAMPGIDPLSDRELCGGPECIRITPQFIGKDPECLRACLERIKLAGYETADLNCGCPFPMVRKKGRGSGILGTPDVLNRMLEVGCGVMGDGRFSAKVRLGVDHAEELLSLMPMLNGFPLRFLVVHARTARQMYEGECDWDAVEAVERVAKMTVVRNGDLQMPQDGSVLENIMIGRGFIRSLGEREDSVTLLRRYVEALFGEMSGDRAVLGAVKELVSYWRGSVLWSRLWHSVKICRTVGELRSVLPC